MTDLSKTIEARSDILNADDLIGKEMTIRVTKVSITAGEQPIAINFEGDNGKPFMPCKTVRRILVNCWGSDGNKYVGRSMTLFRDPKVKFGGLEVGGIRVSHLSNISGPVTMALTASKANKRPFTVKPLSTDQAPQANKAILEGGQTAASNGRAAYTEWLSTLSAEDKASIKHMHTAWSKAANEADAKTDAKADAPPPPDEENII